MIRILLAVLLTALCACSDSATPGPVAADAKPGIRVTVAKPIIRSIEYVLTALGSVESIHHPTISAETSGQIVSIGVKEGESVAARQLMATIDNTLHSIEADKATAELQRQEVLFDNQRREVERLLQLRKSQSVSRDRLEDEQAQLAMLSAQRDVAKKQQQQAMYLESKTRVRAPADGLIAKRHVSLGDYVTPGQPLFKLVSVKTLRARLSFPEHDAASVTVGKRVELTSPIAQGTVAVGEVASVNPQIHPVSRAIDVIVEFDNPGNWYPGASVDAILMVEERTDALTIPALSVVQRAGGPVVFVVNENRASARTVKVGWQDADWIEIVDGLTAGDSVVVEGAALISEGSRLLTNGTSSPP